MIWSIEIFCEVLFDGLKLIVKMLRYVLCFFWFLFDYENHNYAVYSMDLLKFVLLCSKLEELMEYAKSMQPQKRRPAPVQMSQPTIQQVSF